MAVSNGSVSVGTAATAVPVSSVNPFELHIHNDDNTDEVFLGGPDVTTTDGLQLSKLESMTLLMRPADRLFVVSTKTGHSLSWLAITKDI
jgi:hypothetical protein